MPNYNDRTLDHIEGRGIYSTNMHTAAALLALPSRGGLMLKEIAEKAEISEKQLRNWRHDPRFQQLVQKKMNHNVSERMPNVMKTLVDKAEEGSAKHIELLMKYQGMLTEKHEVTAKQDDKPQYDEAEFDRLNDEFEQRLEQMEREGVDLTIDADFEEVEDE